MIKKIFLIFIIPLTLTLTLTTEALAVCPVCTVAVGAGLGISRVLGIDDTVTSVWIGGLILSSSFWLIDWLKKKKPNLPINDYQLAIIFVMYLLVLLPLWFGKYIGRPTNAIWGIDKILFGTVIGSLAFLAGIWLDKKIREIKSKQLFNYQKIVFPFVALVIISLALDILIS